MNQKIFFSILNEYMCIYDNKALAHKPGRERKLVQKQSLTDKTVWDKSSMSISGASCQFGFVYAF